VPDPLIRIFSDLHYGDPASALHSLDVLQPLLAGATQLIFNGDTLDTRPSRDPVAAAALRAEVAEFFRQLPVPTTILTGNHDPDLSAHHAAEIAGGEVYVTHGDVLFEDIVPWSRDAALAGRLVAEALATMSPDQRATTAGQFAACRYAAVRIPQRHQSERNRTKYALSYLADTVWPPGRLLRVLRAWRQAPLRAEAFVRSHRLGARFFVMGHTHRMGLSRTPSGLVVLNTGSFSPPGAAGVIDIGGGRIVLRCLLRRGREYRFGGPLAEFPLAGGALAVTLAA
jgi:predicted phosphodiesterase